ncbi:MAG: DUF4474 domain-containing protein [Anaerocolumna sp.]
MLNYEILKIIFQPLVLYVDSKLIYPIIFLLVFIIILAVTFCLLFSSRRKKKKEPVLKAASFEIKKKKKTSKSGLGSYTLDDLNNDLKPFGFAYYPPQDYFYSIMYGWQSEYGYCELYDEGSAGLSMIIDCEPIYFNYGGKKWLIEFWKGQYGMNSGCEIGIYTTTGPNLNIPGIFNGTFYYCASKEDHLDLAFSLMKNGKEIFHRKELHWWLTGFKLGEFSWPNELTVNNEITLKDSEMRDAFVGGLLKAGYSISDLTIRGNTVSFVYDVPHSRQPKSRTPYVDAYMQENNKRNCEAYNFATGSYRNTVDKLNYVKREAPKLYHKIINIGSKKDLYKIYETIRNFLDIKDRIRFIDKINGIFFNELPEDFKISSSIGANTQASNDILSNSLKLKDLELNNLESNEGAENNTLESSEFHDEVSKL